MSENIFEKMKQNMPKEDLERYKQKGESFYSNFDFKEGKMVSNSLETYSRQIIAALRSGLLAEDLDDNDKKIMENVYGNDWIEKVQKIIDNEN